jgi:hypothetical protein
LPHARIPIVKLSLDPSPGLPSGIACDIGFENRLALENTRLLMCYAMVDPTRVRTMVLFRKSTWVELRTGAAYDLASYCIFKSKYGVNAGTSSWTRALLSNVLILAQGKSTNPIKGHSHPMDTFFSSYISSCTSRIHLYSPIFNKSHHYVPSRRYVCGRIDQDPWCSCTIPTQEDTHLNGYNVWSVSIPG